MTSNSSVNKSIYFEIMRIIGCALVIFNHLPGYGIFGSASGVKQYFYMLLPIVTRINIPLFFMISGALLFQKDEDIKTVLKKRVLRIVLLICFFDLILVAVDRCLCYVSGTVSEVTPKDFILRVLSNKGIIGASIYWYLYAYLGVLFVMPFMCRIAKGLTDEEMIMLFLLRFVVNTLFPMLNLYMQYRGTDKRFLLTDKFSVPFAFVDAFFFMLFGYYLDHRISIKKVRSIHLLIIILIVVSGVVISIICAKADAYLNGKYSDYYLTFLSYVNAGAFFILVKYVTEVKFNGVVNVKLSKFIAFMGSMTLGIYMMDFGFKRLLYDHLASLWRQETPSQLFTLSLAWVMISFTLGTICTSVFKRIPGVRKIM